MSEYKEPYPFTQYEVLMALDAAIARLKVNAEGMDYRLSTASKPDVFYLKEQEKLDRIIKQIDSAYEELDNIHWYS